MSTLRGEVGMTNEKQGVSLWILYATIVELKQENARLRAALTPYSETNLWCLVFMYAQQGDQGLLLWERFGIDARAALATKDSKSE